jgi:hypothetical protein
VDLIAARSGTFFGRPMIAGRLYRVAGSGIAGFRGDKGPARNAEFCINGPNGAFDDPTSGASLTFGWSGNLLVADGCNNRVRLIAVRSGRYFGQTMTAGDVYTIAGTGAPGYSGNGGPAVKAKLSYPTGAGIDHYGNVLIADTENNRVRVIAATTGTFYGQKMTSGRIYTIAGPDGFSSVDGVTTDRHGNVIFTDQAGAVWVVATTDGTFYGQAMTAGGIYQVAGGGATLGDGGPATSALLANVGAVAVSPTGSLLVADGSDNRLRAISP